MPASIEISIKLIVCLSVNNTSSVFALFVPHHRIVPTKEDDSTAVSIPGFVKEWKNPIKTVKGKNLVPVTLELQFLKHDKRQFLDLHEEMRKMAYAPR